MELEEMKTQWGEMSIQIEQQKKITDALILKMIRSDYSHKLNKILIPEVIGSIGCLAAVLFILLNFEKLNTWYLEVCGIAAVLTLCLLSLLSVKAIYRLRSINILKNNFKESLLEYSKGKLQFVFVRKMSFYLGAILMITILPVMGKLVGEKDFFKETNIWFWYAITFPFFYLVSRWVFKKYIKLTGDAENILKELER